MTKGTIRTFTKPKDDNPIITNSNSVAITTGHLEEEQEEKEMYDYCGVAYVSNFNSVYFILLIVSMETNHFLRC